MMRRSLFSALFVSVLLTSCATQQVALDQANNGVSLTQHLQAELARYKLNSKLAAERRLALVRDQESNSLDTFKKRELFSYLNSQSGVTGSAMGESLLRDTSAKYTELLAENEKAEKELANRLAAVVKDIPSPADKLAAVQKALADLGTELSESERLAIVSAFLKDSKKIIDQNVKAAADAASAAAASSPAPAALSGGS